MLHRAEREATIFTHAAMDNRRNLDVAWRTTSLFRPSRNALNNFFQHRWAVLDRDTPVGEFAGQLNTLGRYAGEIDWDFSFGLRDGQTCSSKLRQSGMVAMKDTLHLSNIGAHRRQWFIHRQAIRLVQCSMTRSEPQEESAGGNLVNRQSVQSRLEGWMQKDIKDRGANLNPGSHARQVLGERQGVGGRFGDQEIPKAALLSHFHIFGRTPQRNVGRSGEQQHPRCLHISPFMTLSVFS